MVLLGLQALLWGGGSIVEAKAAAESLSRLTHVEEQGSRACPPLHSHVDCLICRTWHGGASSGQASTAVAAFSVGDDDPSAELVPVANRVFTGTLGSRAPPCA